MTAHFADVATAGFPVDPGTAQYNTLSLTYQNFDTPGSPVSVVLTLVRTVPDKNGIMTRFLQLRDPGRRFGPAHPPARRQHRGWDGNRDGDHPRAVAGERRRYGTETIEAGADIGLTQTECWDATFEATYNDKPWSTTEDVNPGEMSAFCPTLPALPVDISGSLRGAGSKVRCCRTIRSHPPRKKDDLGRAFQANRSPLRTSARGRGPVRREETDLPDP